MLRERRLRIGAGYHATRPDDLTGLERDAARPVAFDPDAGHRCAGADRRPGSTRGLGKRIAERAHSTLGL